jgi:hypothetical protein
VLPPFAKYSVFFESIIWDENIGLPLLYDHFRLPSGSSAYSIPSPDPIYTVPSIPIDGDEDILAVVENDHFKVPVGVNAYMLLF